MPANHSMPHTEEAKQKISLAGLKWWATAPQEKLNARIEAMRFNSVGRIVTEETRQKQRIGNIGKHIITEETRERMSLSHIGIKLNRCKGIMHHSETTKRKLRLANLGKHTMSDETKAKLRLANTGRAMPEGHLAKMLLARKGKPSWNKGLTKLDARIAKNVASKLQNGKTSEGLKRWWRTAPQEEVDARHKAMRIGAQVKPNKFELTIINILNELYPRRWKYVGDGELVICGRNPDIANINGKKSLILLHGIYWHLWRKQKDNPELTKEQVECEDKNFYKVYGWDTLIIWEDELAQVGKIKNKIIEFSEGG